jgi:hypothetical protein
VIGEGSLDSASRREALGGLGLLRETAVATNRGGDLWSSTPRRCREAGGPAAWARDTGGGGVLGQCGRRGSGSALYRRGWRS